MLKISLPDMKITNLRLQLHLPGANELRKVSLDLLLLQVKAIAGLGTTIDVILVNGSIKEGQTVVMGGTDGPIVTQIRGLLMPQPLKELRVKVRFYAPYFSQGQDQISSNSFNLESRSDFTNFN